MAPEARAGLPEGSGGDADPRSRRPYLFPRPSVRLPDGRPSGAETASRGRGRSEGDERNEDDERRDDEGNEEDKAEEVDEVTDVSTGPHRVRAQLRTTGTRGVDEEGGDGTRGLGRGGGGGGSGAGCGRVGGGGGGCGGGGDGMRADVARADVARADGERGDGGRGGCGDGRPNGGGGAQMLENQGPGVEAERCRGTGVVRRCSVKFPAGPGQDHARQEALARLGLLKKDSVGKGDPRGPRSPQCGPRGPARAPSPGAPLSPGPSSPTGSASPTSPTGPTGPLGHAGDGSRGPGRAGRSPPHGQQGQRPGLRPSGITVHFSPRGRAAEEEHREALRKLGLLKA
ncbi:proline and serine-rich protein 2 [Lampetra planeri]